MIVRKANLYSMLAALLVAALPQVFLRPFGGDITVVDLMAPLILGFVMTRVRASLSATDILAAAFLVYSMTVYGLRAGVSSSEAYQAQSAYLLRQAAIFAPIFLGPLMSADRQVFVRSLKAVTFTALAALIFIMLAYAWGSDKFDAHQTLQLGGVGPLVHRLGGLTGETGAFAFNALVFCQLAVAAFAVSVRGVSLSVAAFILVILLMAYELSQARVIILNIGIFIMVLYFSRAVSLQKRVSIVIVSISAMVGALLASLPTEFIHAFFYRFGSLLRGEDLNTITSGRWYHWRDTVLLWTDHPLNLIFGVGNRISVQMLGHAIENVFLQPFSDYGLLGASIFFALLASMLVPIFAAAARGDLLAVVMKAIWVAVIAQWFLNDVLTYYQTFPALLFFSSWFVAIKRAERERIRRSLPTQKSVDGIIAV